MNNILQPLFNKFIILKNKKLTKSLGVHNVLRNYSHETDHIIEEATFIKQLEYCYKIILSNKNYSLLHPAFETYYNIQNFLEDVLKNENNALVLEPEDIKFDSNFIFFAGDKVYLTEYGFTLLHLQTISLLNNVNNLPIKSDSNTIALEDHHDLKHAILKIAKTLRQDKEKRLYLNDFKPLLLYITKTEYENSFCILIKKALSDSFAHLKDPKISSTSLCYSLSHVIILFLSTINTKFNVLLDILQKEDLKDLSQDSFNKNFIESLINVCYYTNPKEIKNKLSQLFLSFDFGLVDHNLYELLYLYIINIFYEKHSKEVIVQLFPRFPFENYTSFRLRKTLKKMEGKLGNSILELLLETDIIIQSKEKKKLKTINQISINSKYVLDFAFQEGYAVKKPMYYFNQHVGINDIQSLIKKQTKFIHERVTKDLKLDTLLLITLIKNERIHRIHKNKSLVLTVNNNYPLNKLTPENRFSIDKRFLRLIMALLIALHIPENKSDLTIDSFNIFFNNESCQYLFTLYNIELKFIKSLLTKYGNDSIFLKELYEILTLAVTFSIPEVTDTEKEKKKKNSGWVKKKLSHEYPWKTIIMDLLNKIQQYRLFLIGTIKDAIIYAPFNYFITSSFLDSRGRLYNDEIFLNIQNNPLSKMLLKLYGPITIDNGLAAWNIIQKTLNVNFNHSFEEAVEKNKELTLNYLFSFFNSNKISFDNFKDFIKGIDKINIDESALLNYVHSNIKKIKKIMIVCSKIMRYLDGDLDIVEYDANNSGVQMISILFHDVDLATSCNLLGQEQNDVYQKVNVMFQEKLKALQEIKNQNIILDNILNEFLNFDTIVYKNNILNSTLIENIVNNQKTNILTLEESVKQMLHYFLTANLNNSTWITQTINHLYKGFKNLNIEIPSQMINDFLMLVPVKEITIIKNCTQAFTSELKTFGKYLLILRVMFSLEKYYKKYPWLDINTDFWNDRELFKKSVMTLYYNAKRTTRIDDFTKFLKEKHETSLSEYDSDSFKKKNYNNLINIIESFFNDYAKTYMTGVISMNKLTNILVNKPKYNNIINQYFKIKIYPRKQHKFSIDHYNNKDKRKQITLQISTEELNKQELKRTLSPNIIHSMDAYIVHTYNRKLSKIQAQLNKDNTNFIIGSYINHDCFASTFPLITRTILKQCYKELIEQNYLSRLGLNNDEINALRPITLLQFKEKFEKDINDNFFK
jgi:hypothetical protein